MLPIISMAKILERKPCKQSDPLQYASKNWTGTALQILRHPRIPDKHKLWAVLDESALPHEILVEASCQFTERIFAAKPADKIDSRSTSAIAAVRSFMNGELAVEKMMSAVRSASTAAWVNAEIWAVASSAEAISWAAQSAWAEAAKAEAAASNTAIDWSLAINKTDAAAIWVTEAAWACEEIWIAEALANLESFVVKTTPLDEATATSAAKITAARVETRRREQKKHVKTLIRLCEMHETSNNR